MTEFIEFGGRVYSVTHTTTPTGTVITEVELKSGTKPSTEEWFEVKDHVVESLRQRGVTIHNYFFIEGT